MSLDESKQYIEEYERLIQKDGYTPTPAMKKRYEDEKRYLEGACAPEAVADPVSDGYAWPYMMPGVIFGQNQITLADGSSDIDQYYVGWWVQDGEGRTRQIVAYDGTTKVATLDNWSAPQPPPGTVYSCPPVQWGTEPESVGPIRWTKHCDTKQWAAPEAAVTQVTLYGLDGSTYSLSSDEWENLINGGSVVIKEAQPGVCYTASLGEGQVVSLSTYPGKVLSWEPPEIVSVLNRKRVITDGKLTLYAEDGVTIEREVDL